MGSLFENWTVWMAASENYPASTEVEVGDAEGVGDVEAGPGAVSDIQVGDVVALVLTLAFGFKLKLKLPTQLGLQLGL